MLKNISADLIIQKFFSHLYITLIVLNAKLNVSSSDIVSFHENK